MRASRILVALLAPAATGATQTTVSDGTRLSRLKGVI